MHKAIKFIVDIDETLLNPIPAWRVYIKSRLGLELGIAEIKINGGIQRALVKRGVGADDIRSLEEFKYNNATNSNLPAMPGAFRNLRTAISVGFGEMEMYLTARPDAVADVTFDNLRKYNAPSARVVFLGSDSQDSASEEKKKVINSMLESSDKLIIIDDNVDLIVDLVRSGSEKILPICVLGPFSSYQLSVARENNIVDSCQTWRSIPAVINRRT